MTQPFYNPTLPQLRPSTAPQLRLAVGIRIYLRIHLCLHFNIIPTIPIRLYSRFCLLPNLACTHRLPFLSTANFSNGYIADVEAASGRMKQKTRAFKGHGTKLDVEGRSTTNKQGDAAPSEDVDEPLFFYMPDAAYGELCQWYPCSFTVSKSQISSLIERPIDDDGDDANDPSDGYITFNCAEQFMMYCKAGRFCDRDTQRRVLASDSPKEQKRLGKLTAGFTDESWDKVKSDVVVAGNVAKFGQDIKLRRKLLATGNRLLVEAASRDRVWGIGYTAKHAMSYRQHWGENRLGRALMQAREQLRKEEGAPLARENWEATAIVTSSEE